jgi:hypothetical protein
MKTNIEQRMMNTELRNWLGTSGYCLMPIVFLALATLALEHILNK